MQVLDEAHNVGFTHGGLATGQSNQDMRCASWRHARACDTGCSCLRPQACCHTTASGIYKQRRQAPAGGADGGRGSLCRAPGLAAMDLAPARGGCPGGLGGPMGDPGGPMDLAVASAGLMGRPSGEPGLPAPVAASMDSAFLVCPGGLQHPRKGQRCKPMASDSGALSCTVLVQSRGQCHQ